MNDIAITHGNYGVRGGGELIVEELAQIFDAPIYTSFVDEDALPEETNLEVNDLFGSGIIGKIIRYDNAISLILRDLYSSFAWERIEDLYDYDIIIQSGHIPGWFVPKDQQVIIRYSNSPHRMAYDLYYKKANSVTKRIYAKLIRLHYQQTIPYPDIYVANSDITARRLERYLGVDRDEIEIVYPPAVNMDKYRDRGGGDFYLALARLVPSKGLDRIIKAFAQFPDKRLVIAGDGPEKERLMNLAGENTEFVGWVEGKKKLELLGNAKALVWSGKDEPFGIPPVEAMACGTPVIGVNDGFTKYQIEDGVTGILYDRGELPSAIVEFEKDGIAGGAERLRKEAAKYSKEKFRERMCDVVEKAQDQAKI